MFGKIFKPKIEHQDPEIRLAAVKALAGKNNLNTLSQIAINDQDERVRQQALSQVQGNFSEKFQLDSSIATKLFSIASEQSFKEKLIPLINDSEQCQQLVDNLEDENSLILFALNASFPTIRKSASERISSLDVLKQLQQKSTDKNVQQIARQKIQSIKTAEKEKLSTHDNLNQICEALERLLKLDYDTQTSSRVHILQTHWQEVDDQYKTDFNGRYQQAVQACQLIINSAMEKQALQEFEFAQNQLCQSICDTYETEITSFDQHSADLWKGKADEINQQWLQVGKNFSPDAQINERFAGLHNAAEKLASVLEGHSQIEKNKDENNNIGKFESLSVLEQRYFDLNKQLSWPFSTSTPKLYSNIKECHAELKTQLNAEQKKHRDKRQEIDKKVGILKSHIRQKNLIKANRLVNYIHNLLCEFPVSLQEKEQQKLEVVTQSLDELRGLNKFVIAPKKEDLCEQMEALIGGVREPEELMQQIKAVQGKWKSLATSDAQADDILWDRFKLAADQAYEPCEVYLKELESLKHSNLESRKRLASEVEAELAKIDWQHVDWKEIQADYNQNWKSWNAITPVFFSENKPVQQHYESLMNQIKDKLNNEKNENHGLYDRLIERGVALVDGLQEDSVDDAIEQMKRLQVSWKNIGITHYNKSNKQWNKFRKLCDQVFEFQRNKHKDLLVQQDQHSDAAYKIIDQIKELKKLPDQQLPASQSDYQDLKQQFDEIAGLPENRQERIEKRFQQVCDEYESHLAGLSARSRVSSHAQIRKAAKLCVDAEILTMDEKGQQKFETIKSEFESIENIPDKALKQLVNRFKQADSVNSGTTEYIVEEQNNNEQHLSELAIQLEVLLDLESPDHAKEQRMNYQLQQLQAGLKPSANKQEKLDRLVATEMQWYGTGPVNVEARKQLETRLQAVIKQAET